MFSLCAGDASRVVARVSWREEGLSGDAAYGEIPAQLLLQRKRGFGMKFWAKNLLAGVHGQCGGRGIDADDDEEQVGPLQAEQAGPHH